MCFVDFVDTIHGCRPWGRKRGARVTHHAGLLGFALILTIRDLELAASVGLDLLLLRWDRRRGGKVNKLIGVGVFHRPR